MDKLDVWDNLFWIVPIYMICLGVFTFLVCIFGLLISGSDNRPLILVYAVLLAVAYLAQLGSILTALELRTIVGESKSNVGALKVKAELEQVS